METNRTLEVDLSEIDGVPFGSVSGRTVWPTWWSSLFPSVYSTRSFSIALGGKKSNQAIVVAVTSIPNPPNPLGCLFFGVCYDCCLTHNIEMQLIKTYAANANFHSSKKKDMAVKLLSGGERVWGSSIRPTLVKRRIKLSVLCSTLRTHIGGRQSCYSVNYTVVWSEGATSCSQKDGCR